MPIAAMWPSNLRGGSERWYIPQGSNFSELNHNFEDLCWENGQLLVVIPSQNGKAQKQPAGLSLPSQSPKDTARQIATSKNVTLEAVLNDAERLTEFPASVPGVEMVDWLDDPIDFSHASGQAAAMRDDLQHVGRPWALVRPKEFGKEDAEAAGMPVVSSMHPTMTRKLIPEDKDTLLSSNAPHCMTSSSIIQSLQNTQRTGAAVFFDGSAATRNVKTSATSNCVNPCVSRHISPASDIESVLVEASEPTRISFSCGSGHGTDKSDKFGHACGKRKTDAIDDFDSESEDSYDVVVARKPLQERSSSTKRTRAAETHNQSERKRRGRINEKLKALQELIPNANKTDKASLLSEAIDYLKKLRLQLQIMSYRSGMGMSPLMTSQGVQHLQMPHAGMGVGEDATLTSFRSLPTHPMIGSTAPVGSAQICPGRSRPSVAQASLQDPFVSTGSLFPPLPTAIPRPLGSQDLSRSVSLHHPFQV